MSSFIRWLSGLPKDQKVVSLNPTQDQTQWCLRFFFKKLSIVLREGNSSIGRTHDTITVMFGKLLFMWYLEDTYFNNCTLCINSESCCLYYYTTLLMKTSNADLVRYFGLYRKHYANLCTQMLHTKQIPQQFAGVTFVCTE